MKYFFTRFIPTAAAFFLLLSTAQAQFSASGTVTDVEGMPLIGVSVLVKGTPSGTVTDLDGRYSVSVPKDPSTLEFSYVGYRSQDVVVTAANSTADVVMEEGANNLDEVVVTGLATSVKRSNLANSVAQISGEELTGTTVQSTMDGALYGKFKGAEIRSNSGAPGGGMSVRLRGVTSLFGDQQPLYIVDGVYIDNSSISSGVNIVTAAAGGGNTSTNQDDASNRVADIDPEDIESIEILKGASAAAIYGNRAAGGVVIISTKKGKAGENKVSFAQTVGAVRPITLLGTRGWDEAKVTEVFGEADAALFRENGEIDYEAELFDHTRLQSTSRLEITGGTQKAAYFVGGTYLNQNGLVENTGYEKASLRASFNFDLAKWLDVSVTSNYINSESNRGLFNNSNSNTTVGYALAFTKPWTDLFPDDNGNYPANPAVGSNVLETINLITNRENVDRFLGSVNVDLKLYSSEKSSLKLQLSGGMDQYTLRTRSLFPSALSYYRDPGSLGGASIEGRTNSTNINTSAFLVHSLYTDSGISFRTQAGGLRFTKDINTVVATATGLNGSQTNLDQAANVGLFQTRQPQEDQGFFVQEEVNFNDIAIVTFGARIDRSTNNGDASKFYTYPKASLALNIHEFDFWAEDGAISSLKLRGAYGAAGRFPGFTTRFNAYPGTSIAGNSGLVSSTLRGNPNIEPETQNETEFGIDLGFMDNRILLDATYYIKTVEDLLLRAGLPPTTGYTAEWINGGALENRGVEIGLTGNVVRNENLNWNTTLSFWKNNSEVTRLDVPAFNTGGFAASLGQFRIEEGKSATQIVGTYRTTDANGNALTQAQIDEIDPDGDGFAVYGDAEPDFNLTWNNNFQFGDFSLSFLWHWKNGGEGINLSTLLYDLGGTTWDYDDTTLDPNGTIPNGDYRTSEWFAGNASPWIEETSYLRMREIGLYYKFPNKVFNDSAGLRLGISGRNLINIFDYNSYDPEVSNFGGNVLANVIEVTPFPSSKTFQFHLKATF